MYADSDVLWENLHYFYREALSVQDEPQKLEKDASAAPEDAIISIKAKLREGKSLVETLWILASVPAIAEKEKKEKVAVDVFLTAHHPSIGQSTQSSLFLLFFLTYCLFCCLVYFEKHAWLKVMQKLGLTITDLIQQHGNVLWQQILTKLQAAEVVAVVKCLD